MYTHKVLRAISFNQANKLCVTILFQGQNKLGKLN